MNRHILLDRLLLLSANSFGDPFFSQSIESPTFKEHLDAVQLDSVTIDGTGYYEMDARTLAGTVKEQFHVMHFLGPEVPTLIYNMGGSESPFDKTMKKVYPLNSVTEINVVAVEAPYQRTIAELKAAFVHLNTYMSMIAVAVKTTELIVQSEAFRDAHTKLVSGASLGGFVANRHHMAYNSADAYLPYVAGTRHGEIFLTTINASEEARANPDQIRSRLNFDYDWFEREHPNVFPQLSRYDQLNQLEVQGPSYGDMEIDIWEGGHLYNYFHPKLMRQKFAQVFSLVN